MLQAQPQSLAQPQSVGDHLRVWRQRRRMSQLDLAAEAGISTRHLSFVETGRAAPSREMVLTLAERLALPLREQNALLVAAGYAPVFSEKKLDDPDMAAQRAAIDLVLKGHAPNPAIAIDRHWTLLNANDATLALFGALVAPALLAPPANVLRASLHPDGLAPHILNLAEWRAHLFERLAQQIDASADATLIALLEELRAYPSHGAVAAAVPNAPVVTPLKLKTPRGVLSMFGTVTIFGTPLDVTLSEIAIESFFPADAESASLLRALVS